MAGNSRAAVGDRGTPAADLLFWKRMAVFEDAVDATAARIVPATKTERLIRKRRLENASG